MAICEHTPCEKRASFDIKGGKGKYCSLHKLPGMIDVKHKRCEHSDGCDSQPTFDLQGGKGRYCKNHKTPGMIDVRNKKCEHSDGCDRVNPTFDLPGGKGRFCKNHILPGMVNVKSKKCEHPDGCDRVNPTFDLPGGKGRFCKSHKAPDMVDVRSKCCEHTGCKHRPTFDIPGGKGRYCKTHKTLGMVDVRNKKCEHPGGCDLRPTYDTQGGIGRYCKKHKSPEMVDVKHTNCEDPGGCDLRPTYDIPGGIGRYCKKHKSPEMVDVMNRKCEDTPCSSPPIYGRPGHPRSHCAKHKQPGMIRRPNGKCKSCKEPAIWGTNWIPIHCEIHKTEDETNLVEKSCASCGLLYILDKENKCENCNPESFATARLAKQNALMDYLNARDLKGDSTDTTIDRGECGKERPDRVFDLGDKIIVLECDENQHGDRQCLCEQTRMVNIGQSFGGTPVYFIRWNPDDYSPENDKKMPEPLAKRYRLVGDLLKSIIKGKTVLPKALVSARYMYYDGWSSLTDEEWKILTPLEG